MRAPASRSAAGPLVGRVDERRRCPRGRLLGRVGSLSWASSATPRLNQIGASWSLSSSACAGQLGRPAEVAGEEGEEARIGDGDDVGVGAEVERLVEVLEGVLEGVLGGDAR